MPILFILISVFMGEQGDIEAHQEIVVTGSMIPTNFSVLARNLTVITREDLVAMGALSLQQVLETVGVDVRERGAGGVQADISLRGGSFEQTLILYDGTKLSDPQTGHHLLNLPVSLDQIERIEILRGPGARIYGPNAFGGVINIIPIKEKAPSRVQIGIGENTYKRASLQTGFERGASSFLLHYQQRSSDGYIPNTDFDQQNLNLNLNIDYKTHRYEISYGQEQKEFGAYHFYHPDFPNQREETKLDFLRLHGTWITARLHFKVNAHSRRHRDHFILDYERPTWFQNLHRTEVNGLDAQVATRNRWGDFALGMESIDERIDSSNLGDHDRNKTGVFLEQQYIGEKWQIQAGTSAYFFSNHGWEIWPGLDIARNISGKSKLSLSVGRSFRLPTFTELYYHGGGNAGNPDLNAEEAWNIEMGYKYQKNTTKIQTAVFERQSEEMIDWVWNPNDRVYHAKNFSSMTTRGFEAELKTKLPSNPLGLNNLRLFYTFLDSSLDTKGNLTKYLLTHPRHTATVTTLFSFAERCTHSWIFRYEQGPNSPQQSFLDFNVTWNLNRFSINLAVKNMADHKVEDFYRVPLPGRWVNLTFGYRFSD